MKNEDEFDELLRNKFSDESSFPFEEDKWARMEEMIIADERKKKLRKFFFIYFSGFITALIILIPIYWFSGNGNGNYKNEKQQTQSKEHLQASSKNVSHTTKKDKIPGDNEPKVTSGDSVSKDSKSNSTQETGSEKTSEIYVAENKTQNEEKINKTVKGSTNDKQNQAASKRKKVRRNKIQNKQENDINKQKLDLTVFDENNKNHSNERGTEANTLEIKKDDSRLKDSISKQEALKAAAKSDSLDLAQKDSILAAQQDSLKLVQSNQIKPDSIIPDPDNFAKFSFYASVGAHYNLGFSANDGQSFSPYIAGVFQYRFSKSWAFNTGLGFFRVSNFNFEKQITERSYDFGYRDHITAIQQKHIYYASIPLEINKIWNKNSFGFGVSPTFIFLNQSEVSTYEKTSLSESDKTSVSSFKHGYGLNPLDVQLSLSYYRYLGNKWLVGGSYNIGLLDVRQNSWTTNNTIERNQFIRLNLIYKIK